MPVGAQSNVAKVKVELPKALPSRLTTLQKACLAATFEANPAACPRGSIVGAARVKTPVLPVQLVGPAYFVSYGGAKFPELVIVLEGYGVRVDLHGATFINSKGITSSTFTQVPDVPFSSFELYLPEGSNSALSANRNLCQLTKLVTIKRKVTQRVGGSTVHRTVITHKREPASLSMPTIFTAQDGAQLRRQTPITVTGCAKQKRAATGAKATRHK